MLRKVLAADRPPDQTQAYYWGLVEKVVRPEIIRKEGEPFSLIRGVPTGQPIAPVIYNLYLHDLDHELEQVPGAFYARYSDDILFAHPHVDTVRAVDHRLDEFLADRHLRVNRAKNENLYLTAAGRPSVQWTQARGTSSVQFVGARVSANGEVGLNRKKMRGLLREVERRAARTARALNGRDVDQVGRAVSAMVNQVLDSDLSPVQERSASLVRRAITDRGQLAQLDYWIARIVARTATGDRGVRAFRRAPYRKIRRDWGLVSLEHSRNQWGRR
jgi:hypothetical protein